jgi:hypothetical protein
MITHMAASDTTVALIGGGAAVLGALIGGVSGWATAATTARRARREARDARRGEAYEAFIIAVDRLERTWRTPATPDDAAATRATGPLTGQAVAAVQRCYVAVLLAGSRRAQEAAGLARTSAWELYDRLYPPGGQPQAVSDPSLNDLVDAFSNDGRAFVKVAQDELNQQRRLALRRRRRRAITRSP